MTKLTTLFKAQKQDGDNWLVTRKSDGKTLIVVAGNRRAAMFLATDPKLETGWS